MRRHADDSGADGAAALRQFVYGDASIEQWVAQGTDDPGEPWASFEQARQFVQGGQLAEAAAIWRRIASTENLESRQVLQAWHFLRQADEHPTADQAKLALGVIAEVPVRDGHDLLAAYRDGSARYLNFSGRALIWEDRSATDIAALISDWLAIGQVIADAIGPWDQPGLPPLPEGQARIMVLTPSGPHFGQGESSALFADPRAAAFLNAATKLMHTLLGRATP
jgi:hypothetical protein